jgi:hypothetical protein
MAICGSQSVCYNKLQGAEYSFALQQQRLAIQPRIPCIWPGSKISPITK